MNYLEEMKNWKNTPTKDKLLIKEMKKVNEKNAEEYFGKTMTFGTAGIRGILGAGTNKINEFTIAAAAYAYAATLLKESPIVKKMGLVIAHDNRQNGAFFAEITARVFDHLGIKTYVFKNNEMAPTPLLSYAIRKLRAAGGVNITASHNPKEYNGFKVYSAQGSQLMSDITNKISKLMNKINFLKVPYGLYKPTFISPNLILDYIKDVLSIRKRGNDRKQLVVIYSPLNGTGAKVAPYIFQKMDIEYYEVKKEMKEDPLFKGLKSCNPEDEGSFSRSIKLAKKKSADIIILTDPDADRVGLAVRTPSGSYKKINGNQTGAIVLNHLIRTKQFTKKGYIAQSIVSGNITKEMAKRKGFSVIETHVGFKNIAEAIRKDPENMIMGYEESYGQLIDQEISRDKDAFQGLVMLVEAANYLKTQNRTLLDELNLIGRMYGFHTSTQISKQMNDEETEFMLQKLASTKLIAGLHVDESLNFTKGEVNGLESAKLVKIILENGSWIAMRPSGTEPKVKFYIETVGQTQKEADKLVKQIIAFINGLIPSFKKQNKEVNKLSEADMEFSSRTRTVELSTKNDEQENIEAKKEISSNQEDDFRDEEIKQENLSEQAIKPELTQVENKKIVEPEFSFDTISPIPSEQTPSQMDPKEVEQTKELMLKQKQEKAQEETTLFDFEEEFFKTQVTKDNNGHEEK
ncbi:phospho-sugar mutase [Mycoplasma marinum]|uniref:Phosphoglucomutase n=1 Tax=Mycoplasma marinum TaxID=1937190 RepID=A0A4R0XN63_9MOLU|nr:phospho-sugar mutase [Mycoplasma marinum]TCG10912.1 hypothetical protein C4B24_03570 [Mycoplasma marinum]